jgi:two-component system sensor histidine kinase KdpD
VQPNPRRRKTPEELLREVQAEVAALATRGHLKIFLGYASGVGKSFRMFDEARRRRERGQDIVVGAVQPSATPEVEAILPHLEVIPMAGTAIDVERIIRRRPTVCVIDGLAYDNPPGRRHPTRWQDVRELLDAGIKVLGSINIQYVDELREKVEAVTGRHAAETVPGAFIRSADEIEIVDAPPEAVAHTPEPLSRLRELALVLAADVVDFQLNDYLERHGIRQNFATHERILVCMTPRANVEEMIVEARAVADRFHGELIAAYVRQHNISPADQAVLDSKLKFAASLGARIEILEGEDPAEALLAYARAHAVTQLYVGHSQRKGLARLRGTPLDQLVWGAYGMDVRVFPQSL